MKDLSTILLFPIFAMVMSCTQHASAAMYCHPERSKPCGNGCISLNKRCTKSWTTSKVGERPASAKKYFDQPKFVENAPPSK